MATAKQATNKAPDPGQPKSATTSRVIIVVLLLVAAFFYVRAVMQDEPATVATPQVSGGETSQTVDQAAASGPAPSKAPVSAGPDTAAETELADRPKAGQFRDVTADPVQPPTPSVTVPPVSAGPKPLPADQMILLLDIFAPELTGSMMSNQPAGAK